MSTLVDIHVPDLGGSHDVPVIDLLVKDGDRIEQDGILLVLESDKATMEVPSPAAGIVRQLQVQVGQKLSQGHLICRLEVEAATTAAPVPAPAPPAPTSAVPPAPAQVAAPAPAPAAATASTRQPIRIPDIGDYQDVPVIDVLVKDGDAVTQDTVLLVLESDKATMEVPSPAAGTVRDLKLKVGDRVSKGAIVCELESAGASPSPAAASPTPVALIPAAPVAAPAPTPAPVPASAAQPGPVPAAAPPPTPADGLVHAGPATRKFARELGVDLAQVKGTGLKDRITVEDVQAHVKARMQAAPGRQAPAAATGGSGIPPIPAQDFSLYGPVEKKDLARIRKLSAAHLSRAWLNIPHVTQFEQADITELEAFRKRASDERGIKLTLLPFLMKALGVALRQYPDFNSSLSPEGDALILKGYCHIGFAADTPNGLVVPVVRDVWGKSLTELAQECADLAKKARDGKLKPDEMKGGCFSISSLGGLGVTGGFTPIVNAPEVGILGVSKATMQPVWDGQGFQPRLLVPLSLSYDHRVIDGAYAARFTTTLASLLADTRRLLL